ncbi:probable beta-1,4-xylosyltransferase GT43E [Phragmites australis]|uniref:probable beta-1,4-xylosyltransferase GT43E n=1 Tax=Phragmites australis TaxID=29695 RepID=UPI002D790812|nr:probable beta-1,4-xylosyltransferase GT43E [Phragmites australis]
MLSSRRNSGVILREGSVRVWSEFNDPSPSPKLLYSQSYVALRGLLASVVSLDFVLLSSKIKSTWAAMTSQRHTRSQERLKSKGLSCKKLAVHLLLCFMVGIFIGFMPFFSVDVYKKIVSENKRLPFHEGLIEKEMMDNKVKELETVVVEKEVELIDEPEVEESPPVPAMLDDDADFAESSPALPAINELDITVKKLLIIVTITSVRPQQAYYLNRLAHVLKDVQSPLLWLVVEWPEQSFETTEILRSSGVMYRHLICKKNTTSVRKIAVCQRNNAIYHIKKYRLDGIMHFADEERSYAGDVFEEMQKIRRFGTWPVATHVGTKYRAVLEGPICKGNRVTGWHTVQTVQKKGVTRRFPIGFSAFAFNTTMLWDPQRWNRPPMDSVAVHSGGRGGLQESRFIEKLVKNDRQVEGFPDNCNRVMVWNFNLEPPQLNYPTGWSLYKNLEPNIPVT